ncbi:hypothetical protein F4780DRAFT_701705 [Xylariomycetidae sp. FL0641]|nr:hypothetical protein F4780DRAFT_701705 [Xylariomycetidae sp. FL0641]
METTGASRWMMSLPYPPGPLSARQLSPSCHRHLSAMSCSVADAQVTSHPEVRAILGGAGPSRSSTILSLVWPSTLSPVNPVSCPDGRGNDEPVAIVVPECELSFSTLCLTAAACRRHGKKRGADRFSLIGLLRSRQSEFVATRYGTVCITLVSGERKGGQLRLDTANARDTPSSNPHSLVLRPSPGTFSTVQDYRLHPFSVAWSCLACPLLPELPTTTGTYCMPPSPITGHSEGSGEVSWELHSLMRVRESFRFLGFPNLTLRLLSAE